MKKNFSIKISILSLVFLLFPKNAEAENIIISFTGFGASAVIDSVIVQNLSKGITVTIPNGNPVYLADSPNAVEIVNDDLESLSIYPNPILESSTLSFYSKTAGITLIKVYSIDGKNILDFKCNLEIGRNSFQLNMPVGIYNIQVTGNGYHCRTKAISQSLTCLTAQIQMKSLNTNTYQQNVKTSGLSTILYAPGNQLLLKAYSGKNSTVVTDKPTTSKTINFEFVECKDADNNNYGVVRIGDQIWMVENLKSTKYNDGTAILNATNNTILADTSKAIYSWYNFDIKNKDVYGALYNLNCVKTTKLAPLNWHIAYDEEWTVLENFLIANGYNYDGTTSGNKIAKSLSSNILWKGDSKVDTINGVIVNNLAANNSSGFNAVPGGSFYDTFSGIGFNASWWGLTQNIAKASVRDMYNNITGTERTTNFDENKWGMSVRCVSYTGNTPFITTNYATSITTTSTVSGGIIVYDGASAIVAKGICWSTAHNPTIDLSTKTNEGTGSGAFESTLTGLKYGTTYYVRSYVSNGATTNYGLEQKFSTPANPYDGNYSCVGYRIRPGNPTEPVAVGTIERFTAVDSVTVKKNGFGSYTVCDIKIVITKDQINVGGVTCYKVNAYPVDISGVIVGGMYSSWTGDALTLPAPPTNPTEINYYNPVTKTFVLNCYYTSSSGNRIMYEVLTRI